MILKWKKSLLPVLRLTNHFAGWKRSDEVNLNDINYEVDSIVGSGGS